jgi:hypothetical protein
MEIVQRILAKVVGQDISVEEMEQVAGGKVDACETMGGYGTVTNDGMMSKCDFN